MFKRIIFLAILFGVLSLSFFSASAQTLGQYDGWGDYYQYDGWGDVVAMKPSIDTSDKAAQKGLLSTLKSNVLNGLEAAGRFVREHAWKEAGSEAIVQASQAAFNQFAQDAAKFFASGGKGQKNPFRIEYVGEMLTNTADNAAGKYIEDFGKAATLGEKFNLCTPNFNARMRIGLGLAAKFDKHEPACTFSKMKERWEEELGREDFLSRFQDIYNPKSNDLGIAFSLQTGILEKQSAEVTYAAQQDEIDEGFKYKTDIAGMRKAAPGSIPKKYDFLNYLYVQNLTKSFPDPFKEAANIFINQLAISSLQNLLDNIGEGKPPSSSKFDRDRLSGLFDYEAGPENSGLAGIKNKLKKIIGPNFKVRGDYNILGELSKCPDPSKAGPTNCVITDSFSEAVSGNYTVGEAMENGYLKPDGKFGFIAGGFAPDYQEGYPYRTMIILRKFRILPIGWELAAQYIKSDSPKAKSEYTLKNMVDCYSSSDEFEGTDEAWCSGLVDPSWVLKAPLNYCKKEGAGPEIVSSAVRGSGADSEISIVRNDKYCADEQSCIKESSGGSCEKYGYCTEEKRMWKFGSDSCDPLFNTCQTYRNTKTKQTASYLANTLNYNDCRADVVGCSEFALEGAYDQPSDYVSWDDLGPKMYLDGDADVCSDKEVGCTELIRTKEGLGTNFITNSSFEDVDLSTGQLKYWGAVGATSSDSYDGAASLELSGDFSWNQEVGPANYEIGGDAYTLSFYAKGCGSDGQFGLGLAGEATSSLVTTSDAWRYFRITRVYPTPFTTNSVNIFIRNFTTPTTPSCYVDAIKLEKGAVATEYADYRQSGLFYQKMIPDYLKNSCYESPGGGNYSLKQDRPDVCDDYARQCNKEEYGCTMYSSVKDKLDLPAKVAADDYCPSECVGYDTYIQTETAFDSLKPQYFIPETAQSCGASSVGCDEFTNLDKIDEGGESREYYSWLKQCVRPDSPGADCREFYTWEGSKTSGYQLRLFSLNAVKAKDRNGDGSIDEDDYEPIVTENDTGLCSEEIYNYSPSNPAYNPNCREFYNKSGTKTYHLIDKTLSCTDNCHPYRKSINNIIKKPDGLDYKPAECTSLASSSPNPQAYGYDTSLNGCSFCKNGGEWNVQHKACIYMTIPNEGRTCSAQQAGCREYSGNTGNNMKDLLSNSFEGSTQGWTGAGTSNVGLSSDSLFAGGNSMEISNGANPSAEYELGHLVNNSSAYVVRFLAKTTGGASNLRVYFLSTSTPDYFTGDSGNAVQLSPEWSLYKMNIARIEHDVSNDEKIVIEADNNINIDDIKLTEIKNRYYLIQDSWKTPESCLSDVFGNYQGPTYNLGCEQYTTGDKENVNLRNFSMLCDASAVGCEIMIDTHNYADYSAVSFNSVTPAVNVPADNYIYGVYSEKALCSSSQKGCQRMGLGSDYDGSTIYNDYYLENNPDKYETILCSDAEAGCAEWKYSDGGSDDLPAYFKNPEYQTCQWRQKTNATSWGWFKQKVAKCDDTPDGRIDPTTESNVCSNAFDCAPSGVVCSSDVDCSSNVCNVALGTCSVTGETCTDDGHCEILGSCLSGQCHSSCITDENDYACNIDVTPKTFGYGGVSRGIFQPNRLGSQYWTGECSAKQSGCTEFIDPVSSFSENMLFNPDFTQNVDSNSTADGWESGSQSVVLDNYTLYILTVEGANTATVRRTGGFFHRLDNNNELSNVGSDLVQVSTAGVRRSVMFFTSLSGLENISADLRVNVSGLANGSKVSIRKAAVSYVKNEDLDRESCNGIANFEDGCIMFNQRDVNGIFGLSQLKWDVDESAGKKGSQSPRPGTVAVDNDANQLIQVEPDRQCDSWLACRSYVQDENGENTCYDIGECNNFDLSGNCSSFITKDSVNQTYSPASANVNKESIANKTGYYKAGYLGSGGYFNEPNDYFEMSTMEQVGGSLHVQNGGFEIRTKDGYPLDWFVGSGSRKWNDNIFSVIDNPALANKYSVEYPMEGNSFLMFDSEESRYGPYSQLIDVQPNADYVVSVYINTKLMKPKGSANIDLYLEVNEFGSNSTSQISSKIPISGVQPGLGWKKYVGKFTSDGNARFIRLKFVSHTSAPVTGDCITDTNTDACSGNVFIDNIGIVPALEAKDLGAGNNWNLVPSCRLFPDKSALSCETTDQNNIKKVGLYGYCLEHDVSPGSEDACLLWYPIDRVQGQGVSEYIGYADRAPLYYGEYDPSHNFKKKIADNYFFSTPSSGNLVEINAKEEDKIFNVLNLLNVEFDCLAAGSGGHYSWGDFPSRNFRFRDQYDLSYLAANPLAVASAVLDEHNQFYDDDELAKLSCDFDNSCVQCRYNAGGGLERCPTGYNDTTELGHGYVARRIDAKVSFTPSRLAVDPWCFDSCEDSHRLSDWNSSTTAPNTVWGAGGNAPVNNGKNSHSISSGNSSVIRIGFDSTGAFKGIKVYLVDDDNNTSDFTCDIYLVGKGITGKIYQVADSEGGSKAFFGRVQRGSQFKIPNAYTGLSLTYASDLRPYGAIVPPSPLYDPSLWDYNPDTPEVEPLFFMIPKNNFYEPRGGQMLDKIDMQNLFAQSYASWKWTTSKICDGGVRDGESCSVLGGLSGSSYCCGENTYCCDIDTNPNCCLEIANPAEKEKCVNAYQNTRCIDKEGYYRVDTDLWNVSDYSPWRCSGERTSLANPFCVGLPKVENFAIDGAVGGAVNINKYKYVKLDFNSVLDREQLPLKSIEIDWQDGDVTKIEGIENTDRPNSLHTVYHEYSYWGIKANNAGSCGATSCSVVPRIRIRDNWGVCNESADCSQWTNYGGSVVVTN